MKCFYHSADLDGMCSGAIVKLNHPNCEMIGIDYVDKFPWSRISAGEDVFMVDFSLEPIEEMAKLNELSELVWIDHHESKIVDEPKLKTKIHGIRKIAQAACELTWEYLRDYRAPEVVILLGRYDVFDLDFDDRILPFQYGMRALGLSVESDKWRRLLCLERDYIRMNDIDPIIKDGKAILRYIKADNAKYAMKHCFNLEFEGHRAVAINRGAANTQLFEEVFDTQYCTLMIAFVLQKDNWVVSLYSLKDGPDVSKIAKKNGGGGHVHAAGFVCDELPFRIPIRKER